MINQVDQLKNMIMMHKSQTDFMAGRATLKLNINASLTQDDYEEMDMGDILPRHSSVQSANFGQKKT